MRIDFHDIAREGSTVQT